MPRPYAYSDAPSICARYGNCCFVWRNLDNSYNGTGIGLLTSGIFREATETSLHHHHHRTHFNGAHAQLADQVSGVCAHAVPEILSFACSGST